MQASVRKCCNSNVRRNVVTGCCLINMSDRGIASGTSHQSRLQDASDPIACTQECLVCLMRCKSCNAGLYTVLATQKESAPLSKGNTCPVSKRKHKPTQQRKHKPTGLQPAHCRCTDNTAEEQLSLWLLQLPSCLSPALECGAGQQPPGPLLCLLHGPERLSGWPAPSLPPCLPPSPFRAPMHRSLQLQFYSRLVSNKRWLGR